MISAARMLGCALALGGLLLGGCAAKRLETGPFKGVDRLTTELRRGVSTKADVQRLLGAPNGRGASLYPTQDTPREIWIYNDVETGDVRREGGTVGRVPTIRMDMRQQILLVFFAGDRFDGYLWSMTVLDTTGKPK